MDSTSLPLDLREELGAGTTGRVWVARLTRAWGPLDRGESIALKRLSAEAAADPARRRAFELEARLACSLSVPGLVRGYASGVDESGPWLAMQFVPGATLRAQLEELGPLPEPQIRRIARRLAGVLEALVRSGYLHGDLKPENIRLDEEGRAVLLDLGFARPLGEAAAGPEEERVAGSLPYLSPEQARGARTTARSEIFSLGVLLYELATGTHPFLDARDRADPTQVPRKLTEAAFTPPSLRVSTVSPFLDLLLGEMLRREPEERPTARELVRRFTEEEKGVWWRGQLDLHREARRSRRAVSREYELPLVGREEELELLLDAAHRALTRPGPEDLAAGGVVELGGVAGSGRSRLMQEFATLVRRSEDPPLYLYSSCSRFQEQRPCQPILTLLSRYLGLPQGEAPGARDRRCLDAFLPADVRDALLDALTPDHEGSVPVSIPVALASWLARLAETRPVIVFLDDVHWADEGTLDVLARLADHLPGLSLLLVLGSRGEAEVRRRVAYRRLREHLDRGPGQERIELGPLDETEVLELVEARFAPSVPRLRLAHALWKRSRGNPGFIAELVRGLVEHGQARRTPDGLLDLAVHPDDLPLPASLRGAVADAYAHLGQKERAWLSRLAVAGGRIRTDFLLAAWPYEDAAELDSILAALETTGWLVPVGDGYRFSRPALREAVYRTLPEARRVQMHSEVAEALRPGPGGRLSLADAFQRAFHLRAAKEDEALLRVLRPLLDRLLERGQPQRVHTIAQWGLEALDRLPASRNLTRLAIELLAAGAEAAGRLGYREKQAALLDRLVDAGNIDPSEDPETAARVYLLHAELAESRGQYGSARAMLRNASDWAEQAGSAELTSESLRRWSAIQGHVGELLEADHLARRARQVAPDPRLRAHAEHALGVVALLRDRIEIALKHTDRCLMLLRRSEGVPTLAVRALAHSLRGRIYRGAGRPRRAYGSAQRALRYARRTGDRQLEAELMARLGVQLLDLDRTSEAETTLRDALLLAQDIEDRRCEAIASIFLGILLAENEDPEAKRHLRRGTELATEQGQGRVEAVGLSLQARLRFRGALIGALGHSSRAVELVERYGAELIDRLVIVGTHAVILDAVGRGTEARERIRALRKRMREENERITAPLLKRRQRVASTRLLEAVLSLEGPIYRRVRLQGLSG